MQNTSLLKAGNDKQYCAGNKMISQSNAAEQAKLFVALDTAERVN